MHISARKLRGCRRKKNKALAVSLSIDGLPWSGNPALPTQTQLIDDNADYSTQCTIPNSAIFTPFDLPNPTDNSSSLLDNSQTEISNIFHSEIDQTLPILQFDDFSLEMLRACERGEARASGGAWVGDASSMVARSFSAQPDSCKEYGHGRHSTSADFSMTIEAEWRPCGRRLSDINDGIYREETTQVASQCNRRAPITSSDGDGLKDTAEMNVYFTEYDDPDSDNDGLSDGTEVLGLGTDPLDPDTDRDGILDGDEPKVIYRTDAPFVYEDGSLTGKPSWINLDTDWQDYTFGLDNFTVLGSLSSGVLNGGITGTGIGNTPEGYNITYDSNQVTIWIQDTIDYETGDYKLYHIIYSGKSGTESTIPKQAYAIEGLEIYGGLSPTSSDTDGDGLYDGGDVSASYSLDGKAHTGELTVGTEPLNPDTDGDSANDGQEAVFGYDLIWMEQASNGDIISNEVYINPDFGLALDVHNYWTDPRTGKSEWRDLDRDGISDWNETHYDTAFSFITGWANARQVEWEQNPDDSPEFNATQYLESQFNPFMKENTPPIILDMSVDTVYEYHYEWVIVKVVDNFFASVWLEVYDSAPVSLLLNVGDGFSTSVIPFTLSGGQNNFGFAMNLDYPSMYTNGYKVNVTIHDSSSNYNWMEIEVDGLFTGVFDFLATIWDSMVGVFSAVAGAVASAMSALADIIFDMIEELIETAFETLETLIAGFAYQLIDIVLDSIASVSFGSIHVIWQSISKVLGQLLFFSSLGITIAGSIAGIALALLATKVMTGGLSGVLLDGIGGASVGVIISTLIGAIIFQTFSAVFGFGFIPEGLVGGSTLLLAFTDLIIWAGAIYAISTRSFSTLKIVAPLGLFFSTLSMCILLMKYFISDYIQEEWTRAYVSFIIDIIALEVAIMAVVSIINLPYVYKLNYGILYDIVKVLPYVNLFIVLVSLIPDAATLIDLGLIIEEG